MEIFFIKIKNLAQMIFHPARFEFIQNLFTFRSYTLNPEVILLKVFAISDNFSVVFSIPNIALICSSTLELIFSVPDAISLEFEIKNYMC
jgi:hypothetical protein